MRFEPSSVDLEALPLCVGCGLGFFIVHPFFSRDVLRDEELHNVSVVFGDTGKWRPRGYVGVADTK